MLAVSAELFKDHSGSAPANASDPRRRRLKIGNPLAVPLSGQMPDQLRRKTEDGKEAKPIKPNQGPVPGNANFVAGSGRSRSRTTPPPAIA